MLVVDDMIDIRNAEVVRSVHPIPFLFLLLTLRIIIVIYPFVQCQMISIASFLPIMCSVRERKPTAQFIEVFLSSFLQLRRLHVDLIFETIPNARFYSTITGHVYST